MAEDQHPLLTTKAFGLIGLAALACTGIGFMMASPNVFWGGALVAAFSACGIGSLALSDYRVAYKKVFQQKAWPSLGEAFELLLPATILIVLTILVVPQISVIPPAKPGDLLLADIQKAPALGEDFLPRPLTMRDLFDTDYTAEANGYGPVTTAIAFGQHLSLQNQTNGKNYDVPVKLIFDFGSNTKFLTYYISSQDDSFEIAKALAANTNVALKEMDDRFRMTLKMPTDTASISSRKAAFSNLVIMYFETELPLQHQAQIEAIFNSHNITVQLHGQVYLVAHWQEHRLRQKFHKINGIP